MCWLHRGDDAEFREPWNVIERDDLRMLDSGPQRCTLRGRHLMFKRVEADAVASIANRVDIQLPAVLRRERGQLLHLLRRIEHQAAMMMLIAASLQQRRAAAAQCAIDPRLDGTQLQSIVELRRFRPLADRGARCFVVGQHGVDADG